MSKQLTEFTETRSQKPLPIQRDVDEVPFGNVDGDIIEAANRFVNELSQQYELDGVQQERLKVGRLGEYVSGTYFEAQVDRSVYPPSEGDGGSDFTARGDETDVKTCWRGPRELTVDLDTLGNADQYLLAEYRNGVIYLLGIISAEELRRIGQRSPYNNRISLRPKYLRYLPRKHITTEDIKRVQSII